jgi:hypothetical protein
VSVDEASLPGQQVVVENAVFKGCQLKGHAVMVSVAGGTQSRSPVKLPLKQRTPNWTYAVLAHVVEQDLGGVKIDAAIVVILIE